jgi:hypothetical protein
MRNLKKGLLVRVTATRNCRKIFGVFVPLIVVLVVEHLIVD